MKSKNVYTLIGAIICIAVIVVWKLNSYYKQEKTVFVENQIHQQTLNIVTSVSSQLSQLKNIISSYRGQIDEGQINWVQLSPFFTLAQVEISDQGFYKIKNLYVKSGSVADAWSTDYLQKAFSYSLFSNKEIHGQLFQNLKGNKFLSLMFSEEKIKNNRQAVVLIGDAQYFQKYFDMQRSGLGINLLITQDDIVAAHTQSEYIATKSQEKKNDSAKYYFDKDEIRSSNLAVISYSVKNAKSDYIAIPLFILILIFGFVFVLIGLVLYLVRPLVNEARKAEIFKKVFDEIQTAPAVTEIINKVPEISHAVPVTDAVVVNKLHDHFEKDNDIILKNTVAPHFNFIGVQNNQPHKIILAAMTALDFKIQSESLKISVINESNKLYECDFERFKKAFENIILNAIESHSKKMTIKIYDVNIKSEKQTAVTTYVDIFDDGKGIETGLADKIWQPFYGTKNKRDHKGLGLSEAMSVFIRYGASISLIENTNMYSTGAAFRINMNADKNIEIKSEQIATLTEFSADDDFDIDAILQLDDLSEDSDLNSKNSFKQQFTTTQFKLDTSDEIDLKSFNEHKIDFKKSEKAADRMAVKIRKPGRL